MRLMIRLGIVGALAEAYLSCQVVIQSALQSAFEQTCGGSCSGGASGRHAASCSKCPRLPPAVGRGLRDTTSPIEFESLVSASFTIQKGLPSRSS